MARQDRPAILVQTVQTARTETSDRRAIKAIRARKATTVTKVTKVLTASLHPIKALLSRWHSLQQPLRRIQRRRRRRPADRLERKDLLEQLELQARSLVLRVLQDLRTFAYKPSRG